MEKETLTLAEVAKILGLAPRAVCRKVEAGEIPRPMLGGTSTRRWSRAAFRKWLDALAEPSVEPKKK